MEDVEYQKLCHANDKTLKAFNELKKTVMMYDDIKGLHPYLEFRLVALKAAINKASEILK